MEITQGHYTYGNLLRKGFQKSPSCQVDFYWSTDEQDSYIKRLWDLLSYSVPIRWVRKRNIDFKRFRIKLALANIAKQLVDQKIGQSEFVVLHLHTYVLAFLLLDLMRKLPTVVSLDMTASQVSQRTSRSFRWTHYPNILLGKQVFDNAARIVTFSEWARQSVINDYKIDERKVQVIYPGVDLKVLTPSKIKQENSQDHFSILFIGNDFKRKGGYDVLEVFLETFLEKAELILVTNAPVKCQHPNIQIYRDVQAYTSEWIELYHRADVFVLPTYFEAFGWVFIEAMAAGLPIIATRINAIPEIVNHGETGFLIQPGDRNGLAYCLKELMENRTLRHQMGTKGRKVVEQKFNAHTHCQILEDVFREASLLKQAFEGRST